MADGAPHETAARRPAPPGRRLAAFVLDWGIGLGLAVICGIVAWAVWLAGSHGASRQPSDAVIYTGLVVLSLSLPLWAAGTIVCWSRWGQTPGLAATALRITDARGETPHPLRALVRVVVLALGAVPAVLAPILLVGLAAAAAQSTLPLVIALLALVPLLVPVADLLCWLLTPERTALHDLAAGTRVAYAIRSGLSQAGANRREEA